MDTGEQDYLIRLMEGKLLKGSILILKFRAIETIVTELTV